MTTRQPTEPGWDANGSPVEYSFESPEDTAEWEAAARRIRLCLAKPVTYREPYDCGTGL